MDNDKDKYALLIKHLSDEIVVRFQNTMLFRTRIAFLTWIGPLIVLSSVVVATKGNFDIPINKLTLTSIIVIAICYICLGIIGGYIEALEWHTVRKLRVSIYNITKDGNLDGVDSVVYTKEKNPKQPPGGHRLRYALDLMSYVLPYALVLISTAAMTILAVNIEIPD